MGMCGLSNNTAVESSGFGPNYAISLPLESVESRVTQGKYMNNMHLVPVNLKLLGWNKSSNAYLKKAFEQQIKHD